MLRGLLLKLGFCDKWVNLIMLCVQSVEYFLLSEGEEIGTIHPKRGLRQGDPLSPYLFILLAEGLTALINKEETRGNFHEVGVARGAPKVTHLLFADDSFVFFRADSKESQTCKNILDVYASATGQLVNLDKSSLTFSKNVCKQVRKDVVRF